MSAAWMSRNERQDIGRKLRLGCTVAFRGSERPMGVAFVGHEVADKIALMRNRRVGLIVIVAPSRGPRLHSLA